jgi:hypothetical protein
MAHLLHDIVQIPGPSPSGPGFCLYLLEVFVDFEISQSS